MSGIEERFHIRRLLGTGSFGVVYEAFDSHRNRTVALKTLTRADADSVARFKREFRSLAELRHPNLASLYEIFMLGHEWALSMELIRGTDLLEHLSFAEIQSAFLDPEVSESFDPDARISLRRRSVKEGKLSAAYFRNVRDSFRQLAEAIAFLHVADDGSGKPMLAHAVAARLAGLSTSAQRIFSLLRDADGPLPEDEVERRLELFESDEPLRTLTRSRLVRLRRRGECSSWICITRCCGRNAYADYDLFETLRL